MAADLQAILAHLISVLCGCEIARIEVNLVTIGNVLLRKMIPDALPLLVAESNHPTFIADRARSAILR